MDGPLLGVGREESDDGVFGDRRVLAEKVKKEKDLPKIRDSRVANGNPPVLACKLQRLNREGKGGHMVMYGQHMYWSMP
jgi:hypothetical protein